MTVDTREKYGKLPGPSWGTTVIDRADWIDPAKEYRTRRGKRVICLEIVLHNSCGNEVTFPVKGTIIDREAKPGTREKLRYMIWTLDGRSSVFEGDPRDDLILQAKDAN